MTVPAVLRDKYENGAPREERAVRRPMNFRGLVRGADVRNFARFRLVDLLAEVIEKGVEVAAIVADHAGEGRALFLCEPDAGDVDVEDLEVAVILYEPPVDGDLFAAVRELDFALHDGLLVALRLGAENVELLIVVVGKPRDIDLDDEGLHEAEILGLLFRRRRAQVLAEREGGDTVHVRRLVEELAELRFAFRLRGVLV